MLAEVLEARYWVVEAVVTELKRAVVGEVQEVPVLMLEAVVARGLLVPAVLSPKAYVNLAAEAAFSQLEGAVPSTMLRSVAGVHHWVFS